MILITILAALVLCSCQIPGMNQSGASTQKDVTNIDENKDKSPKRMDLGDLTANLTPTTYFGGESSGGGTAIVCRDTNQQIQSVEMLESYEAKILRGWQVPEFQTPYKNQVDDAENLLRSEPYLYREFRRARKVVNDSIEFLPPGVLINPQPDLGRDEAIVVPDQCELKVVGYFESNGRLLVSETLFDSMTETQKAMFITHETLYLLARHFSVVEDSVSTRKVTSQLFANLEADEWLVDLETVANNFSWEKKYYEDFLIVKSPNSNRKIKVRGRLVYDGDRIYEARVGCLKLAQGGKKVEIPSNTEIEFEVDMNKCRGIIFTSGGYFPPNKPQIIFDVFYEDRLLLSVDKLYGQTDGKVVVYIEP